MRDDLPIWRSMLFVPVHVERFVAKAHTHGADAIILDLEDSVPPAEKERARSLVGPVAEKVARENADVVVRINRPWRMAIKDMEASVGGKVRALMLPKVAGAEHIRLAAEVLSELEAERNIAPGTTQLIAMIETPDALLQAREIATASPRLVGLMVGTEDLAQSAGMAVDSEGLIYTNQVVVFAARAAGICPLGIVGTVAEYKDLDAVRETIRRSRKLGYSGSPCVHPSVVPILNEEFAPSAADVNRAREMIAAYEQAEAAGLGAVEFEGRMIDVPVVDRARDLIRAHNKIAERQNR